MIQYRNPLNLNQCSFDDNHTAVITYGGQVNFIGTSFISNTTGWMAYDMDGNSRIEDCLFTNNNVGIDIMGQHDANLYITQTIIENNDWGIKSFGQLYCRMNCSSVSDNNTGIYAGNYQWLLGGRSRNRFQNNQVAIRLEEVDNLFVFEGENDFSGSQMYITGTFSGVALNYLYLNPITNAYELNVKDNRIPVVAGNTRIHLRDWNDDPIYLHNYTPMPAYMNICEATQTVGFEDYVLTNWASTININIQQNQIPLNDAVILAKNLITTNELQHTKTDLEAVDLFDVILSQVRNENIQQQLTKNDYVILEIALNKMMEAHNNAYRFGLIARVRAVKDLPKNPYLAAILAEVNHRIANEYACGMAEKTLPSLLLTKAQLFRTAEHYDYSLEALTELKNNFGTYWSATADYWECICRAEEELILETIDAEHFEKIRLGCLSLGPMERRGQPAMQGDAVQNNMHTFNYTLFPNPVTSSIYLKSDQLIGEAMVEVFDLAGKMLSKHHWLDCGDVLEIQTADLKSGTYLLKINGPESIQSIRFVKF
jgi:hypothetical protein